MLFAARRLLGPGLVRPSARGLATTAGATPLGETMYTAEEFRAKHQIKVSNIDLKDPTFAPVTSFETLSFNKDVLKVLQSLGFTAPTATQAQSWPVAASGRDIISVAKTGSGKTLSFLVPAFSKILDSRRKSKNPKVLVLAPTRELCIQIQKEAQHFQRLGLRSAACFGGASRFTQMNEIRKGVDAIIATPGRCNDFLETGTLNMDEIDYVVLDEADRMLDMGFEPQIREILNDIPKTKQMLLFTATWPKEVVRLAQSYVKSDAVHIHIGDEGLNANKAIKQHFIMMGNTRGSSKLKALIELMAELRTDTNDGRSIPKLILFCQRKADCDFLEEDLIREGYSCAALHGDKSQSVRDNIMHNFRSGRVRVLIATDVASRGLDVSDVEAVINYEFPLSGVEDYIHRIGRTARGDRTGSSYTFFSSSDESHAEDLIEILRKSGQEIPEELLDIMHSNRAPFAKKAKFGTRGSAGGSRYGSSDRDSGRGGGGFGGRGGGGGGGFGGQGGGGGGFGGRGGGGGGGFGGRGGDRRDSYDDRSDGYNSRKPSGRSGGMDNYLRDEEPARGRGGGSSYRQQNGRGGRGNTDDAFNERDSLRGWSR